MVPSTQDVAAQPPRVLRAEMPGFAQVYVKQVTQGSSPCRHAIGLRRSSLNSRTVASVHVHPLLQRSELRASIKSNNLWPECKKHFRKFRWCFFGTGGLRQPEKFGRKSVLLLSFIAATILVNETNLTRSVSCTRPSRRFQSTPRCGEVAERPKAPVC